MRQPVSGGTLTIMSVPAVTPRVAAPRSRSRASGPRPRTASRQASAVVVGTPPSRRLELETISSHWQLALDAAQRALGAAGRSLPLHELERRRRDLVRERQETATTLTQLARTTGIRPLPWLSPEPVTRRALGLPTTVDACLFDLDGVLTDSGVLHAWAWGKVFDDLLMGFAETTGWQFIPFDRAADYEAYIDGRSRIEGIHAFLASRGIRLPEGEPDDPAQADTAWGVARRKGETLARGLLQRGVTALPGAHRYLAAAGHAGLGRAVVSASASTLPMLELAGLATLVEERVDADVIRAEHLRTRPAPDLLLVACRRLGIRPEHVVTFTHSAAGVAAGHAAGVAVVGVGDGAQGELLRGFGAERVVPSLAALLNPRLADAPRR
jgi:HAD superfamily hydrolase (TIGR01509 family)